MTLEQLRVFIAVAEREHVTQASRHLGLTQSGVSAAVAALERSFDVQLFDRVGRRITLTAAGREFLHEARAVLARAEAAETVLSDLAQMRRGTLSLAASQVIANYWLPPLMNTYRLQYPGVTVRLAIANTEQVKAWSREGSVDIGFVEGKVEDASLSITSVPGDELVVVCVTGDPRIENPDLNALLKSLPWVFRETGSGSRSLFESALKRLGIGSDELNVVMELPSNEAVRSAVLAGAGAAAISRLVVADDLRRGVLTKLPVQLCRRRFLILHHSQRYRSHAERAFLALMNSATQNRDLLVADGRYLMHALPPENIAGRSSSPTSKRLI